jgi:glycerophosphoryl diester phosphodiesterase
MLVPPGNTLASLRKAIEVGAQMLEVDVRRTKDDVLVLDHDAVRYFDGEETPIRARTFAEWQAHTAETDAPMMTLDDAFYLAGQARVGLMLDFKEPGTEALLARAIRQSGFPMQALLVPGADETSRKILRGLDPRIPLSLSLDIGDRSRINAKFVADIDTDAVTWHHRLITPQLVNVLRARGILVYAWTVNLSEDIRRVRHECKVDGLISDSPDLVKSII